MNKFQTPKSKLVLVTLVINFLLLAGCGMGGNSAVSEKSKDKTITEVIINTSPKVTATIDVVNKSITIAVPYGTDLTKVTLAITHNGASIDPDPATPQGFSAGKSIKYTVTAEDGSTQDYTVSITVKEPIITFDTDGGDTIASITVKKGEKATAPTAPTKKDFKFIEWRLDGETFDFDTPITKNITLNAIWIEVLNASFTDWETRAVTGGVQITSYKGTDTNVIIPTTIDGKKVLGLGNTIAYTNIFNGNPESRTTNILTIDLSKAIYLTSIGNEAFTNCSSLTRITIPDSVTSIGYFAFSYCIALTSITIPDSVTSIGTKAFAYCTALKDVTLSNTLTSIAFGVFKDCTSLARITIPDSVTSIESKAFFATKITAITLPNDCTYEANSFESTVTVTGGEKSS